MRTGDWLQLASIHQFINLSIYQSINLLLDRRAHRRGKNFENTSGLHLVLRRLRSTHRRPDGSNLSLVRHGRSLELPVSLSDESQKLGGVQALTISQTSSPMLRKRCGMRLLK